MDRTKRGILKKWRFVAAIGALVVPLVVTGYGALLFLTPKPAHSSAKPELPNIILFNADDLGYFDVGFNGNPVIQTPNLDRFAAEGVTFSAFYAPAPLCSPSRAGLLTGRFPNRTGIYDTLKGFAAMHLPHSELTAAELLRTAGYDTVHIGKWHLSDLRKGPKNKKVLGDYGFNYAVSDPYMLAWQVASLAQDWVQRFSEPDRPFFLNLAPFEPHSPAGSYAPTLYRRLYDTPESEAAAQRIPYPGFTRPNAVWELRNNYFGAVTQMDDAFGHLMDFLDEAGLRDNTFILFTSDNGPARGGAASFGSAAPFSGCKMKLYEGGIRVPGVVHWPRAMTRGLQVAEAVHGVDLLPTICDLAKITLPTDRKLDGTSILPLLTGGTIQRKTPLYWSYWAGSPRRPVENGLGAGGMQAALRDGDWKILGRLENLGPEQPVMDFIREARFDRFELYDLSEDPTESNDLAKARPEVLKRLKTKLIDLHREVSAEGPSWDLEHFRVKSMR